MDIKAVAHLGRFKDIIVTLFKYGFDDIVERLDLPGKVIIEKIYSVPGDMSTWKRIRYALEELGPTFIKLGQILSLRPDLMPPPLILELQKLQDEVTPVPYAEIEEVLLRNLNAPISEVFDVFEQQPIAAASLAQVHRAVLKENKQAVAVKIQRPEIRHMIDTDLYILAVLARQLHERMESTHVYDLPELVREFKRNLLRELDFRRETRNMKISQGNFSGIPDVRIPKLYEDYCTEQMITMELILGTKLRDLQLETLADRESLAKRGLRMTIKQVLEDGFFHADPHPGNVFILDNHVFCLIDWGMVGRLTRETRFEVIEIIKAVVEKDSEKLVDLLLHFTDWDVDLNQRLLQREVLDIMDVYHNIPIREINVSQLLWDIAGLLQEHHIKLPTDMAVMIKALVTAEGTARQLYPDLNVVAETEPYIEKLAMEQWKPKTIWRSIRRSLNHLYNLQKQLPAKIERIVEKVDHGELSIQFQHKNLEGMRGTLENIANRLTLGVIIAAMIIGSSMIIITGVKPLLFGFPAFGIIGYVISALLGLWLVYNIIRTRKY